MEKAKHTPGNEVKRLENFPGYAVSECGRVFSFRKWRGKEGLHQLANIDNGNGYSKVRVSTARGRRNIPVHRLVAEAFLPPRPSINHEVRHLNGDKLDNRSVNLEWGTRQDNANDRELHGHTSRGTGHSDRVKAGLSRRRLIAAAPDLLAACERMVRDQDRPVFSTDFRGAVDELRAAIAKATGGAA